MAWDTPGPSVPLVYKPEQQPVLGGQITPHASAWFCFLFFAFTAHHPYSTFSLLTPYRCTLLFGVLVCLLFLSQSTSWAVITSTGKTGATFGLHIHDPEDGL